MGRRVRVIKYAALALALITVVLAGGYFTAVESGSRSVKAAYTAAGSYSFGWISDTQNYSQSYPEIFASMTNWLKAEAGGRIKYLFHTGDVVNNMADEKQWQNALSAMQVLDGSLSYSIAAGNHDVGRDEVDYTRFLEYFGRIGEGTDRDIERYGGGIVTAERFEAGRTRYLVLAVGYGADKAALDWAGELLSRHSEYITILITHDYMRADGRLSDNGQLLLEKLVRGHPSVRLVLCGHNHNAEKNILPLDDDGDGKADRTVIQLLADYQAMPDGGGGYIRLLTIDERKKTLTVTTYSPYYDDYDCFEPITHPQKDSFEISIKDWF